MSSPAQLRKQIEAALAGRIPAALSPPPRSAPELLSCGLAEVDAVLGGGVPLGAITELTGGDSCGRTTLALATLAAITQQGESCAYVDVCDALDPLSAAALGVELRRLLWVRSTLRQAISSPAISSQSTLRLEQGLRATDLLLNAGGFRAVVLDMGETPPEQARRVPLATWYRFRLQAEKSRTLLLLISNQSVAQSCAALSLSFHPARARWRQAAPGAPPLLAGMDYCLSLERSRSAEAIRKKPAAFAKAAWRSTAVWAG